MQYRRYQSFPVIRREVSEVEMRVSFARMTRVCMCVILIDVFTIVHDEIGSALAPRGDSMAQPKRRANLKRSENYFPD
jgi:hypothetical protein